MRAGRVRDDAVGKVSEAAEAGLAVEVGEAGTNPSDEVRTSGAVGEVGEAAEAGLAVEAGVSPGGGGESLDGCTGSEGDGGGGTQASEEPPGAARQTGEFRSRVGGGEAVDDPSTASVKVWVVGEVALESPVKR